MFKWVSVVCSKETFWNSSSFDIYYNYYYYYRVCSICVDRSFYNRAYAAFVFPARMLRIYYTNVSVLLTWVLRVCCQILSGSLISRDWIFCDTTKYSPDRRDMMKIVLFEFLSSKHYCMENESFKLIKYNALWSVRMNYFKQNRLSTSVVIHTTIHFYSAINNIYIYISAPWAHFSLDSFTIFTLLFTFYLLFLSSILCTYMHF